MWALTGHSVPAPYRTAGTADAGLPRQGDEPG
ncbi:MAG: hypothetical protein JWQ37_729 [Blastococcus sp.]|nr:hypothetical protein [Blastococcus sp.]